MKILVITPSFFPQLGGISSFVNNMITNWPNSDEFVIYTTHCPGYKEYDKNSKIKIFRGKISGIMAMIKIYQIAKKENIDVIHVHCPKFLTKTTQWIFTKYVKRKFRLFFHGVDFNYFKNDVEKRKRIEKLIITAEKVVVNSNYLKDKFSEIFGAIVKDIVVIFPCPSTHFFKKVDDQVLLELKKKLALEGKKVIITVARLDEGKGYPRLISVLPTVLKKFPNLVWLIIGDGKKKTEFIDLIKKNGMQNIIRYMGNVDHFELSKYYQISDVFTLLIHPDKKAEENCSTVYLEASASALPIVAGSVGGVNEQVHNLKTGIIVDANNTEESASAIIKLLSNPINSKAMGEYGQSWVKTVFDWKIQNAKLQ